MKIVLAFVLALCTMFSGTSESIAAGPNSFMFASLKDKRGGWLGVSIQDMTPRLARSMELKVNEGALVNDVVDDSPAEKAGIKDEDIIVEYNGRKITDADDLTSAVRESKPGSSVAIVVTRKDDKQSLQATVGETPKRDLTMIAPRAGRDVVVWNNSEMLGLQLRELNEQLGAYFGAPNNQGVLVEEVEENSNASKAGFKAGDVLIKVGRKTIEDINDVRRALYAYDEGEKVEVEVIRKGSKQVLSVEAEDMDDDGIYKFKFDHRPHGFNLEDMELRGLEDLHMKLPELESLLELERLGPDMGKLKLDLNRMKREIRKNMRDAQQEIKRELRRALPGSSVGT